MPAQNVLFVIVDDQRADTIGACGNDDIHTPTLDRLARNGSHLQPHTNVPVCTPSRAELLSGRTGFENGVRWFGERLEDDVTPLPDVLTSAGYRTCFTGKWHLERHPTEAGYDEVHRYREGGMIEGDHWIEFEEDESTVRGHSTDLIAEAAIDFVRSTTDPWFCHVGFFSPHDPRTPPEPFASMYDPADVSLPENYMPEHPFDNGEMTIRDELLETWPRNPDAIRRHLADYYGMITHHDYQIGRMLDALEQTGQLEETLIVFTSDHGLGIGSHGLMGKENLYEHSTRVPLLLSGPGVPSDRQFDTLVGHCDFYPTLLDLLDIDEPAGIDGRSYVPVLRDESDHHRTEMCCTYRDRQRSIRTDRWKYIVYPETDHEQLFDLENDPNELCNLLDKWRLRSDDQWGYEPPIEPERVDAVTADLRERLHEWQIEVGDELAHITIE
ncbi:sulfatase-like hydrolase/transferase [Halobacteria archaeon AArc-m2/3/4]|uniref:Sulfatase-like hydrolase/transferase n=1 Tax=Natronoglomus mannanivorans TaxID=2979990 RepID=A0AAP3E4X5_9EURY|nr:sulfatase-like hydrolase/transferase [Halobacteria archaeon AArc-xg1-1]MCU4976000.1 sulfatase-like hydrolase/transferase [Halobacteria archaeon AArc-m2/3/4]